jgi:uncharacterized paraquat-inducible protein A
MTWCESCEREVPDGELAEDGTCPVCGHALRTEDEAPEQRRPVPWTFKLMIVATVVYLGYRAYQGIAWVVHHA